MFQFKTLLWNCLLAFILLLILVLFAYKLDTKLGNVVNYNEALL